MIQLKSLLVEAITNVKQAQELGEKIGIDWDKSKFKPSDLLQGFKVELEHRDVTKGDPVMTAKIAWAHLKEKPDYYQRLKAVED
jgi:hypothetical protein